MSVTLEDNAGRSLRVNAWNWGVLHHAVACAKPPLFDDAAFLEQLRFGGATLTQSQNDDLIDYLGDTVLPLLEPGQRMFLDFTVTDEPDDGTFHRDNLEKNYSLQCEVLVDVLDFLLQAEPPIKVL